MAPPFFSFRSESERKIINIPWRAGALFLRDCQTGTYIYGRGRTKNSISAKSKRASSPQREIWDFQAKANCPPLVFSLVAFFRVESTTHVLRIRRQIWNENESHRTLLHESHTLLRERERHTVQYFTSCCTKAATFRRSQREKNKEAVCVCAESRH